MKRCKAEYLLIKMILLKSLICKDLPFTLDYLDYQRKCLPCIHYMHLDEYFSVIWKAVTLLILQTKQIPYFILSCYFNLNFLLSFQSAVLPAFAVLTYIFVWTIKTTPRGGGGGTSI